MTDRPVLFYDGDCRFCRASAKAIAVLDRQHRYAVLPFDDPAADQMLATLPEERRGESIQIAQPDGWVVSAGDALIELARIVPGGGLVAELAWQNDGVRRAFDCAYRAVAGHRGTLSQLVPDVARPVRRP